MTTHPPQAMFPIRDPGDLGEARRYAVALASDLGFDETDRGRVALVVSEAGTNISKHATAGEILVCARFDGEQRAVEVLALDRGPGMADVGRCLTDGYSTAGSAGTGLGAIRRLSSFFDVYSAVGAGTALVCRLAPGRAATPDANASARVGGVNLPLRGEPVCGDAWAHVENGDRTTLLVVDGLGHGRQAFEAAQHAVRVFRAHAGHKPEEVLERAHGVLRSTRGAAAAIAEVRAHQGQVRYAGVGNVAGVIATASSTRSMVSHNGTLGLEARRFQGFDYPLPQGAVLIMHSDGLATHWDLGRYPGLLFRDPSLLAGVLYRDHARGRDDVTVIAMRPT